MAKNVDRRRTVQSQEERRCFNQARSHQLTFDRPLKPDPATDASLHIAACARERLCRGFSRASDVWG